MCERGGGLRFFVACFQGTRDIAPLLVVFDRESPDGELSCVEVDVLVVVELGCEFGAIARVRNLVDSGHSAGNILGPDAAVEVVEGVT